MAQLLLLNGPNLGLLGLREPEVYGKTTLDEIVRAAKQQAKSLGHELTAYQSDAEHELIAHIHAARGKADVILVNPGAFTHTSVAIRDAFLGVAVPFIELHLSNVFAREAFRQHSYLSDVAIGVISGFGAASYELAITAADRFLAQRRP